MQHLYKKAEDRTGCGDRIQRWVGETYEVQVVSGQNGIRVHIWRAPGVDYSPDVPTISVLGNVTTTPLRMDICSGHRTVLFESIPAVQQAWEWYLETITGIQKCFIIPLNDGTFDFEADEISCQTSPTPAEYMVVVNRTRQDGCDCEQYVSSYVITPPDWVAADDNKSWHLFFRETVADFLRTPDGKEAWEETCQDFNWGDIGTYISSEFLAQYGIREYHNGDPLSISGVVILNVNQDETFARPEDDED